MSLQKIVEKTVSELKDKKLPVGVFLATHAADSITTVFLCNRLGASEELIPASRYFLESYGCIKGSIIADVIAIPLSLILACGVGKVLLRLNQPKTAKGRRFWGHLPFYIFSGLNTYSAAGNIVYYLGLV